MVVRFRLTFFSVLAAAISCADPHFKTNEPLDPLTPLGAYIFLSGICGAEVQPGQPTVDGSSADFPASSLAFRDAAGDGTGGQDIVSLSVLQDGSLLYFYLAMNNAPLSGSVGIFAGGKGGSVTFASGTATTTACPAAGSDVGASYGASGVEIYVNPGKCLNGVPGHARFAASAVSPSGSDFGQSSCDFHWGF